MSTIGKACAVPRNLLGGIDAALRLNVRPEGGSMDIVRQYNTVAASVRRLPPNSMACKMPYGRYVDCFFDLVGKVSRILHRKPGFTAALKAEVTTANAPVDLLPERFSRFYQELHSGAAKYLVNPTGDGEFELPPTKILIDSTLALAGRSIGLQVEMRR